METVIEESIWNIEHQTPIRRAVLKDDGTKITRKLFVFGDTQEENSHVDVIDSLSISVEIYSVIFIAFIVC